MVPKLTTFFFSSAQDELEARRQKQLEDEKIKQEIIAAQAKHRREELEAELALQTKLREETTAVMGQELLTEWQHQVHSLRDENEELRKTLTRAQSRAKKREAELRDAVEQKDMERRAEWESAQTYIRRLEVSSPPLLSPPVFGPMSTPPPVINDVTVNPDPPTTNFLSPLNVPHKAPNFMSKLKQRSQHQSISSPSA